MRRSVLLPALFATVLVGACETPTEEGTEGGTGTTTAGPEISITVTEPKRPEDPPLVRGGELAIKGEIKTKKGAVPKTVEIVSSSNGKAFAGQLENNGKNFSAKVDTAQLIDGDPKKACNKAVSLAVTVYDAKKQVAGGDTIDLEVDNCMPAAVVESPAQSSVHIGKFHVKVKVADPRLNYAKFEIFDPAKPEGEQLQVAKQLLQAGTVEFDIDWRQSPTTELHAVLTGVDMAGNVTEIVNPFTVLAQPSFLGNSDDGDQFERTLHDFALIDLDGDGLQDTVNVGPDGLMIRAGLPRTNQKGEPLDASGNPIALDEQGKPLPNEGEEEPPKFVHSGRFAPWKAIRNDDNTPVPGLWVPGADLRKVLMVDLDGVGGPGDVDAEAPPPNDVLAVGVDPAGKPVAWALLYGKVGVKKAEGKPDQERWGYRLVDQLPLPEEPLSAALAVLNLKEDDRPDLVVGAKTDNKGLTTVLIEPELQCKVGAEFKPCAEVELSKVSSAKVFRQGSTHTAVHKGVTQITSIAVGNFFDDPQKVDDICVGEGARPYVSCYRNAKQDGSLEQAQDAFVMLDTGDVSLIAPAEFYTLGGGDDGIDLIVGSKKGVVRWLRGNGKGKFFADSGKLVGPPGSQFYPHLRYLGGFAPTHMEIAPIGPGKKPYLVLVSGGREIVEVPVALEDDAAARMCFRAWIAGGAVDKVRFKDLNLDGRLDLVALDHVPSGTPVSFGLIERDSKGAPLPLEPVDFNAPRVYHLCAIPPDGPEVFGVHEISRAVVEDFDNDAKKLPDVLIWGKRGKSMQPGFSGSCQPPGGKPVFKPVWPVHLFLNAGGRPNPSPRAGEFAPYATGQSQKAGLPTEGCDPPAKQFGSVQDVELADLDSKAGLDMVTVRTDSDYPVGTDPPPESQCDKKCGFSEENEVVNTFGLESPEGKIEDVTRCCRNYTAKDTKKEGAPLTGYGAGAPLERASALVWLNENPLNPFGLVPSGTPAAPVVVQPYYAMAAGRNPKAVAIADLNNDKIRDLVTVMQPSGSATEKTYLHQRIRVFKGDGKGKFTVSPQTGGKRPVLDDSGKWQADLPTTYKNTGEEPIDIVTCPWGKSKLPGLFVFNKKANNFTIFGTQGNLALPAAIDVLGGDDVQTFTAEDVNQDGRCDLLMALSSSIGWLRGNDGAEGFETKANLVEKGNEVASVVSGDVNRDGKPDLIMVDKKSSVVQFFLGDGHGGFALYAGELRAIPGVKEARVRDVDGDTCQDLVVTSEYGVTYLKNIATAIGSNGQPCNPQ